MKNNEIRSKAVQANIKLWQIADKLNINDGNFSRKLRHELPEDEKRKILNIIDELVQEQEGA